MAHSRHRHKHHHTTHPTHLPHAEKKKKSAKGFMMILLAVFGAVIPLVAIGNNLLWIAAGAIAGAVAGYFLGNQIDKSAGKM